MTTPAGLKRSVLPVIGIVIIGAGLWAFADPKGFYESTATYPPYNEHFIHDIGAFMTGLGAALLAAVWIRSGLTVALVANAAAALLHALAHIIDRDLGGKASDPWLLSAVALLFVAAAARRLRAR